MSECVMKRTSKHLLLTALFDGFITPVRTVTDLITHFIHLNTLSTPTLELVRTCYTELLSKETRRVISVHKIKSKNTDVS